MAASKFIAQSMLKSRAFWMTMFEAYFNSAVEMIQGDKVNEAQ